MAKYDGWVVKISVYNPFLHVFMFAEKRMEVVKKFEELMGKGEWRKYRRRGTHKIVKVNLVEVE